MVAYCTPNARRVLSGLCLDAVQTYSFVRQSEMCMLRFVAPGEKHTQPECLKVTRFRSIVGYLFLTYTFICWQYIYLHIGIQLKLAIAPLCAVLMIFLNVQYIY